MSIESNPSGRIGFSREQVLAEVKQIVGEQLGTAPENIREADDLINDLNCDSLTVIEIAMEVEEHFGITVPDEVAQEHRTVADVVHAVMQLLRAPPAATP